MRSTVPAQHSRFKVLYGVEVWIEPSSNPKKVIEFQPGQFAPAPHAHVYLCHNERSAKKVVAALTPISDRFLEEDARGS